MSSTKKTVQPRGWAKPRGYANGIVAEGGRLLFIAGQVGWEPTSEKARFPEGFAAQFDQALANVVEVLREAGGAPEDLVRVTLYVCDKQAYRAASHSVGQSWKRHLGAHFPAMALIEVAALLEDEALVEIEATAVL